MPLSRDEKQAEKARAERDFYYQQQMERLKRGEEDVELTAAEIFQAIGGLAFLALLIWTLSLVF